MLDIETNLGLLKELPKEVLSKLNISSAYLSGETEKIWRGCSETICSIIYSSDYRYVLIR